jgi:hypothetical protein
LEGVICLATKVEIKDYTEQILASWNEKGGSFMTEVKDLVAGQASSNSPVDTGDLARSFLEDSYVDENEGVAYIGSSLKYSVYQEFGTGEYALEGNGRIGGWVYCSNDGKYHFTKGVRPQRMLYRAIKTTSPMIEERAKQIFGTVNKNG